MNTIDKEEKRAIRDEQGRFKPGFSGNPSGRTKTKLLTNALVKYLTEVDPNTGKERFKDLIEILTSEAKSGNINALKEIFDRTEGKAPQSIDMTTDGESFNQFTDEQIDRIAERRLEKR